MSELYELPEEWEWKKIIDVANITNKTINVDDNERYNCIGLEHIESGTGKLVNFEPLNGEDIKSNKVFFKKDMVLYGKLRPYLNKVWKADFDGIATTEILPFDPIKTILDADYLSHYFRTNYFVNNAMKNISGARMPRITTKYLKNKAHIPLPPLQEQKRIVAKLDALFERIDRAIALHQQNIDEADAFMGSVLNEVFGELEGRYEKDIIKNVLKIAQYGFSTKSSENGKYPFLRMGDLQNGKILLNNLKYVNLSDDDFSKYKLEKYDLLFNRTNSYELVGKTSIYEFDKDMSFASYLVRLRVDSERILPYFLNYYLNAESTQKTLKEMATKAVNQSNINAQKLKSISVPIPPLKTQQKTVTYFDKLSAKTEQLKSLQAQKMQSLKDLKASLLDRAFRGEI